MIVASHSHDDESEPKPNESESESESNERKDRAPPEGSQLFIHDLDNSTQRRSERSQRAWTELHHLYHDALIAHATRALGNSRTVTHAAEDIEGEAWFRAVQNWEGFEYRKKGALLAWLRVLIDRVVQDLVRKEARRSDLVKDAYLTLLPALDAQDPADGPSTAATKRDLSEKAQEALARVPSFYRQRIKLVFLEERDRSQVAKELGVKPNTLTRQVLRGMDLWKSQFHDASDGTRELS